MNPGGLVDKFEKRRGINVLDLIEGPVMAWRDLHRRKGPSGKEEARKLPARERTAGQLPARRNRAGKRVLNLFYRAKHERPAAGIVVKSSHLAAAAVDHIKHFI